MFEGVYLSGEINRKGKEYIYDGERVFEGEYLYNQRSSFCDGKLEFKGEYLYNSKLNGISYDQNGNILYVKKMENDM